MAKADKTAETPEFYRKMLLRKREEVLSALGAGARAFDASLGGLGGCPYAPGATGNIVTEDLAFMLEAMGFETGIDIERLLAVRELLARTLPNAALHGAIAKAGLPKNFQPVPVAQAAE